MNNNVATAIKRWPTCHVTLLSSPRVDISQLGWRASLMLSQKGATDLPQQGRLVRTWMRLHNQWCQLLNSDPYCSNYGSVLLRLWPRDRWRMDLSATNQYLSGASRWNSNSTKYHNRTHNTVSHRKPFKTIFTTQHVGLRHRWNVCHNVLTTQKCICQGHIVAPSCLVSGDTKTMQKFQLDHL